MRERLTYANVMSTLAVFLLLGGGAVAATKIGSKDIAKNAIKSKHIKKGQVKKADIKANAVNSKRVADGSLTAADMVAEEPVHVIGAPGEPTFRNGGDGDCVWYDVSTSPEVDGWAPVGFRKDRFGYVHLSGVFAGDDAPDGDGQCGGPADTLDDLHAFTLPPGYQPAKTAVFPVGNGSVMIVGAGGAVMPTGTLEPGAIMVTDPTFGVGGDAITFPAAGTVPARKSGARTAPAQVTSDALPGILEDFGL